ncbi:MAG: RNA polymerase sigma-70 factor [Dysgonomonas sp.]
MEDKQINFANNIKSFEKLFYNLQPRLYAYCRKYVDDTELAKDIVQECFGNLWDNYDNISSSKEYYLFRSVHNQCISHFRNRKVHYRYEDEIKAALKEIEISPEISYPLAELYMKEVEDMLEQSINNLPEKCKQIFIMSRYHGMKNKEIADALNISSRTVEAQIYNALKILKSDLRDYLTLLLLSLLN